VGSQIPYQSSSYLCSSLPCFVYAQHAHPTNGSSTRRVWRA
jgi:hypothetical protein